MDIVQLVARLGIPRLTLATTAAIKAGEFIVRMRNQPTIQVTAKGKGDLLTSLDSGSQAIILDCLQGGGVPLDEIFPEEVLAGYKTGDVAKLRPETTGWVVDPLDGTADVGLHYETGRTSVMLAYREGGFTLFSVVHFPFSGETYYAADGHGAFLNGKKFMVPGGFTELPSCGITFNLQSDFGNFSPFIWNLWNNLHRAGACRFAEAPPAHSGLTCRVASGHLVAGAHDGSKRDRKQMPWDIAPTLLVAQLAGAVVLDEHGRPIDPFWEGPFIVASTEPLAHKLIALGHVQVPMM